MAVNLGELFYNISLESSGLEKNALDSEKKIISLEKKIDNLKKTAEKGASLNIDTKEISGAKREIDVLEKELDGLRSKSNSTMSSMNSGALSAVSGFSNLKLAVVGVGSALLVAGGAVGKFAIEAGKPMEQAEARMKSMLGSTEAVNSSMSILRDASYRTGNSIIDLADNFGKMSVFVQSGHITLKEATDLSLGLSDAMVALGGDSNNLGNVMYGLSQAMGSGVVRAEEFNQVMEPLPGLLNRIERENGMVSGSLRTMVNDGKVTSDQFKTLLIPALKSFQTEANNMSNTLTANQGKMSATFQALGEDIYDSIKNPLSDSIKLLDEFLQRFVSTKRASKEELSRRLEEIKNQQSSISDGRNLGRYASRQNQLSFEASNKQQEIMASLFPIGEAIPTEKAKKKTNTGGGGGGTVKTGGSTKDDGRAEAERQLQERLQLQQQYSQLETDLIQNKFDQQAAIARQTYENRKAQIAEFEANGIATMQQRQALEAQSEVDLTNRLLEIERQRQEQKLQLETEYRQFRAEGMATELEQQLALEDLNYQQRLEKLRAFLEQKVITEAEFKGLSASEEENHKARQDKTIEEDRKKKEKEIEKTYKGNFLAKLAYENKSLETAKFLSSEETKTKIDGFEKTMSAMASTSKEAFEINKALSIANATIAGVESAIYSFKAGAKIGGPIVGGIFAAASVAFTAAQISSIASAQFQGGRKAGGHVSPNSTYRVAEDNQPELLSMGGETFLMTGNKGGKVTSNANMQGGGVVIKIINQAAGIEFTENRISDGEVEIIARRVVMKETPDLFSRELSNPNSKMSRAVGGNYKVDRRR